MIASTKQNKTKNKIQKNLRDPQIFMTPAQGRFSTK